MMRSPCQLIQGLGCYTVVCTGTPCFYQVDANLALLLHRLTSAEPRRLLPITRPRKIRNASGGDEEIHENWALIER